MNGTTVRRLVAAVLIVLWAASLSAAAAPGREKARVVLARSPKAVSERNVADRVECARLLERALTALTGAADAKGAWLALGLRPTDVVAVKLNCNNWTIQLNPHVELVAALTQSLSLVVPENQIILYEGNSADLEESGFPLNTSNKGVRCFGGDRGGGYDEKERVTNIVARTATKIVNLASLKCLDGDMAASLFFKNHIGSLIPADMPKCHGNADFMAQVLARPSIRAKTLLNICDGLRGSYRRGVPWYWGGIILGIDPVATEKAALGVIDEKRVKEGVAPLEYPAHLRIAEEKYGLGSSAAGRGEIVRINL